MLEVAWWGSLRNLFVTGRDLEILTAPVPPPKILIVHFHMLDPANLSPVNVKAQGQYGRNIWVRETPLITAGEGLEDIKEGDMKLLKIF